MGDKEIITSLLEYGADLNIKDQNGHTPLDLATQPVHLDVIISLLTNGAKPAKGVKNYINKPFPDGRTLLHVASQMGRKEIVTFLLERGADPNIQDANGCTALHLATQMGHKEIITSLLVYKAKPNIKDNNSLIPLHYAILSSKRDLIDSLLAVYNADAINTPLPDGRTLLQVATQRGDKELMTSLLVSGANQNIKDKNGSIPLHFAIESGDRDLVDSLLVSAKNNVEDTVNTPFPDGRTPLQVATKMGHIGIITSLLIYGANPTVTDQNGLIPLHAAVLSGNRDLVEALLVDHEDTANIPLPDGRTLLQVATEMRDKELIATLIKNGADPNKANNLGYTPLHVAVRMRDKEIVTTLLAKSADPTIKDKLGRIPLHNAICSGQVKVDTFFKRNCFSNCIGLI